MQRCEMLLCSFFIMQPMVLGLTMCWCIILSVSLVTFVLFGWRDQYLRCLVNQHQHSGTKRSIYKKDFPYNGLCATILQASLSTFFWESRSRGRGEGPSPLPFTEGSGRGEGNPSLQTCCSTIEASPFSLEPFENFNMVNTIEESRISNPFADTPIPLPFQGEDQRLSPTPTSTRDSNLPISQPFNSECAGFGKKLGKSGGSSGSGPPYHGSKAELGFRNKQEDRHDERIDYYKPNFAHMAHERIPPMLRGRLPQSQKGVGLQKYRSVSLDIQTQDCDQTLHFFAVYDGHGGEQTSQFCKENLARKLLEIFERNDANGLARSTVQEHQQLEGALINGMVYRCYVQI
eukprot:TRINITY_DN10851_c0_g1_i5.p1 TRINITY_DN10851_c0_g1~~TRINITY_DN10851_c0_g1_i5.p1  ORF type:complete len:346 (-),score=29.91 TRINITY_DN10851_c0_g1_i5:32-1069(-)